MEIILKIELTRLTDEARSLLMDFISKSDARPLLTRTEEMQQQIIAKKEETKKEEPIKKIRASKKEITPEVEAETDPVETEMKPEITIEDIRDKVVALRDAGKKTKTLEVMQAYGIAKLSDLDKTQYSAFINSLNNIK